MRKNCNQWIIEQPTMVLRGVEVYQEALNRAQQEHLLQEIRDIVAQAPLFSPMTPHGRPMSVKMTSAGQFGWLSDVNGHRYSKEHPAGGAWPPIPDCLLSIWKSVSKSDRSPECCLVNLYRETAKMGLHQDKDEADFSHPVVSISLGDDGLFRVGNTARGGKTESLWLKSGDIVVMGGETRLVYHGIDKTRSGSSTLLKGGGRLNLTMRVVT